MLIPIYIGITNLITTPIYNISKLIVQRKAKNIIASNTSLIIIGIAGSFGKTSTKNFLHELIRYNYKTQIIPGNISFPIGIANWIINKFDKNTQVLVFETDGYKQGEVKSVCQMLPPDFAIITSIGDQHLERLGSRTTLAQTLFELIENSKPNAKIVLSKEIESEFERLGISIKSKVEREIIYNVRLKHTPTNLLPEQLQNLSLANRIALELEVPENIIDDTNSKMTTPDRRGNVTEYLGYKTLDMSYNISATTSRSALNNARSLAGKNKLIVVTAGIPELGKENAKANIELGKDIATVADEIFVLKSDFHKEILDGISTSQTNKSIIFTGSNMKDFNEWLNTKSDKTKHFLLLLPELTDLYY